MDNQLPDQSIEQMQLRANQAMLMKQHHEAIKIYSQIISRVKDVYDARDTATLYAQRANCYLSAKIYAEAPNDSNKAISLDRRNALGYVVKAEILIKSQNLLEAQNVIQACRQEAGDLILLSQLENTIQNSWLTKVGFWWVIKRYFYAVLTGYNQCLQAILGNRLTNPTSGSASGNDSTSTPETHHL